MRWFRLKYVLPSVLGLIAAGVFLHAPHLLAQVTDSLADVGTASGLTAEDPKIIIARIIRVVIGALGVLSVLIVLYGGFTWMTAAGNEEKLERAKKILIRGVIGLAIILLSFAIASFILSALLGATGANGGNTGDNGSGGGGFGGSSSTSSFTVMDYSPDSAVAIRNVLLRVTFSQNLDATTLNNNLVVKNISGAAVDGTITVSGNTASFRPNAACPSPNETRYCFDADTAFMVSISTAVKSSNGTTLVCTSTSCSSSFMTGSLVDTENPTAVITVPSGSVESGSSALVQVHATDDSQVADASFSAEDVQFDSVGATGEDLSDTTIETNWDTTALVNSTSYKLATTVTDIAGNTSDDIIHVTARGPWCFNEVIDTSHGETGLNCGGDSANIDYCGACTGGACTTDADCGPSASCVDSVCTELPEITDISPLSGAVGTFVTISGVGFGSTQPTVTFTAADGGTVVALVPSCSTWSSTGVVVMVPDGAVTGPITITTGATIPLSDSSSDDYGEIFPDFEVNDVIHPKLCALLPTSGAPTDAVVLSGLDFGDAQGTSTVAFGTNAASSYTGWSDSSLNVTAPSARDGSYAVEVTVNGVASNTILYNLSTAVTTVPIIASISPSSAAIGDYITLTGSNFGADVGQVFFENKDSGYKALADVSFPAACSDYWSDTQVTVIVPTNYQNGDSIVAGSNFAIYLVASANGATSALTDFTITSNAPSPGICAISPDTGAAGDTITITGSLGSATGTVNFFSGIPATLTSAWNSTTITVTAPGGATSGPVQVLSASGVASNTLNFTYGDSTADTTLPPGPAAYQWYFSTGTIPTTPEIVTECNLATGGRISAVPNSTFTTSVCPQAVVYAEFTELMNRGTIDEAVSILKCSSDACTGGSDITADGVLTVSNSSPTTFTWIPNTPFLTATSYKVSVSTAAISSPGGIAMAADASWRFTVSSDGAACAVNNVSVSPATSTIDAEGDTDIFNAVPSDACVVLDATQYVYDWTVDDSIAGLTSSTDPVCAGGNSSCTLVQANAEGTTDVTAEERASNVEGNAVLTINFTDPYVADYWPSCNEACRNGSIGASFNTNMDAVSLTAPGAVKLYECPNELCSVGVGDEVADYAVIAANCDSTDPTHCRQVDISLPATTYLTPGKFYRVVISGDVATPSGVALTRTNYTGDYSWTFGVKEGTDVCAVSRLAVTPDAATASQVGERQNFAVSAYGEMDACSTSGQLLATTGFDWSFADWTDNGSNSSIDVASWLPNAEVDTDKNGITAGCTALCIPGGSQPYAAICGDGRIGDGGSRSFGEECEDGNFNDGDGCSSSCLREGGNGGSYWAPLCGNGIQDQQGDHSGEDCDDGNNRSGDGCSAACLDEGSQSVNATCGNNDRAFETTIGGEDCDDGNVTNGDGCSSLCLNEGSVSSSDIGGASCGDGTITPYYETCDDGNSVDGDGCSAICLTEAVTAYLGSSTDYTVPSFCGDGLTGQGEYPGCEASSGDSNVDDLQLAEISLQAAQEVDADTNMAVASMYVTEPESGISTELTPSTYTLVCSALQDNDCALPEVVGIGVNNCCMERPTVTLHPTGRNVCRNAEISGLFTTEMDLASFLSTPEGGTAQPLMFAKLNLGSVPDHLCPTDHTRLAIAATSHLAWYSRGWFAVRQLFTGRSAEAAANDCVVPVTSFTQEAIDVLGVTNYKVVMHYDIPLLPNARYTLEVITDNDVTDSTRPGVHSSNDVAMYNPTGFAWQDFTTSAEICTLDSVVVTDSDTESPSYFSQATESHDFAATAYTYNGATSEPIESLSGVYSWNWAWAEDMNATIVTTTGGTTADLADTADVAAVGENGEANVLATATIDFDLFGTAEGTAVAGTNQVIAFLCENTWPDIKTATFPWSDDASLAEGAVLGSAGWMNFSDFYCRDAGVAQDTSDDYAALTVQNAADYSTTDNILKEYLFKVDDGSGDAIGYRVVTNSDYLSPAAWFTAQGFSGNPTVTTVDGFQAVQDGRTTYIAAVNESGSTLYPNIYVISYNDGASESTKAIYEQLLANLSFAVNVSDVALCSDGSAYTAETCTADADCATGETCANSKIKLTRDVKRLSDLRTISSQVSTYSSTYVTSDVPTLAAGTYVRGLGASVWGSWTDLLGGALGDSSLLADPLNAFLGCGVEASALASYDATTCVNQANGQYICPAGSHVYHYKAAGSANYTLYADLEYSAAGWYYDYDTATDDAVTYQVSSPLSTAAGFTTAVFCDGATVYGSTGNCGDGVVNGGETCEIGQRGGDTIACDTDSTVDSNLDGDATNDGNGVQSEVCQSDCSAFIADTSATCVAPACGNGVIDYDLLEECDDGSLNGRYGYCGSSCSLTEDAFYCGDGSLAGGEVCDCGSTTTTDARPTGGVGYVCGGTTSASYVNGDYQQDPNESCAWDCQGPASYCGDGIIDSGEVCDGDTDPYEGAICNDRSGTMAGQACETDSQCEAGTSSSSHTSLRPKCGLTAGGEESPAFAACPITTVCQFSDDATLIGQACTSNSDCGAGGTCSNNTYQTYRTRVCDDDGASGGTCNWTDADVGYEGITCKALNNCGDGVVDTGEECDDGNTDSGDTCTNQCKTNVCGDGYLQLDTEQCDEGVNNGGGCTSAYESTCTACSVSCKYTSLSGEFCGDGVANGDEYCDAYDLPNSYVSAVSLIPSEHEGGTYYNATTFGSNNPTGTDSFVYVNTAVTCADAGDRTTTTGLYSYTDLHTDTIATTCQTVGQCNGGDSTDTVRGLGAACLSDADCSSNDCQFPVCASSCNSTCPETYLSEAMLLTNNEPGAASASSVDLYTYSDSTTSDLPNAATITFPACRVGATLTADVSLDNVTAPEVYVTFVTDLSGSMNWSFTPEDTAEISNYNLYDATYERIDAAKEGLTNSLSALYGVDNMHVALVSFHGTSANLDSDFGVATSEADQLDVIATYSATGGTPTDLGLLEAKAAFDNYTAMPTGNVRRIIVLLTDGEATDPGAATTAAEIIKGVDENGDDIPDYELYTIALTTTDTFIRTVAGWSSNDPAVETVDRTQPNNLTNIDYAYHGSSSSAITDAYNAIVASITQPTFTLVTSGGITTSGSVMEGVGVAVPWPEGFICDQSAEQTLPLRVTFAGEGQVNISNVKFNYCTP